MWRHPQGAARFLLGSSPRPLRGSWCPLNGALPWEAPWPLAEPQLADTPVSKLGLEAGAWHPGSPGRPVRLAQGPRSQVPQWL